MAKTKEVTPGAEPDMITSVLAVGLTEPESICNEQHLAILYTKQPLHTPPLFLLTSRGLASF